eukprot:1677484-Alexandrium_andersonii.AAC.1
MSASLVGSEMCIRDSIIAARPCLISAARKLRKDFSSPFLQKPAGSKSVSYTHLTLPTICSV